jgi:UDP-N-acetylglucosamine acyltransferase
MSGVENDVIPYGSVMGDRARLGGLNIRGLQRRGFSRDELQALRSAYHLLFAERGTLVERVEEVAQLHNGAKPVREIVDFIRADSSRALCQPRSASSGG